MPVLVRTNIINAEICECLVPTFLLALHFDGSGIEIAVTLDEHKNCFLSSVKNVGTAST